MTAVEPSSTQVPPVSSMRWPQKKPLVPPENAQYEGNIYERFNRSEKRIILVVVSISGLMPLFVGSSFIPSIPQIANDLNISASTVSLAVSLSVFANALGGLVWSAYSSFYGRRPMFLWGMPLMAIGSLGTACSTNIFSHLFWRFVQAFGSTSGMALGPAVIGDVSKLEERGTALGSFFGASLFGLALAPLVGGAVAQWWSWQGFQMLLGVWGVVHMVVVYVFLPETAHPTSCSIDKMGEGLKERPLWVNPFSSLSLLRSPVLSITTLSSTLILLPDYVLLVPLAYTVGARYNIIDQGLIGACFLPSGIGNFIGAVAGGRLSDTIVMEWKKKRHGAWYPEDRLRAASLGALYLVPLSACIAGFTIMYIPGTIGLIITLACLFTNGIGVDMVFTPLNAYTVDLMGSQSAEALAAVAAMRSLLLAPLFALILPSIDYIGVAATNTISALLALLGYFLIWLTIRYGDRMRAYVDVGYVTTDDLVIGSEEMTIRHT